MGDNVLTVGQPRMGWFADGDAGTPDAVALLQDHGDRISLMIPWLGRAEASQHERWFQGASTLYGDDPDRIHYAYRPPQSLAFADADGFVALIGCRAKSSRSDFSTGIGHGVIDVRVAILGGEGLSFGAINGLRSEVPGLSDWVGLRSLHESVTRDSNGRVKAVDLRLESHEPVRLARRLNVCLRSNFSVSRPVEADTTSLHESLQVQTLVKKPRMWVDHIRVHNTVRELVDVAGWRPFGYTRLWAHRVDDPERLLSGEGIGQKWALAHTYAVRRHNPIPSRPSFLFQFEDVGVSGFKKWMHLRHAFSRGIGPLISLLDQETAYLETQLVQSGIGLDGIGYQLALEAGVSDRLARDERHSKRLQRIVDELRLARFQTSTTGFSGLPTPTTA